MQNEGEDATHTITVETHPQPTDGATKRTRTTIEAERINFHEDSIEDWHATELEKVLFDNDLTAIVIGKNYRDTMMKFMKALPHANAEEVVHQGRLNQSVEAFSKDYDTLMQELQQNLKKHTETDLRQNTDSSDEYRKFVQLRTKLTTTYRHGQHVKKQIYKYKSNNDIDLIPVNITFKPTLLGREFEEDFFQKISHSVKNTNYEALEKLADIIRGEICDLKDFLKTCSNFLIAKATRTVFLSNKGLRDEVFITNKHLKPNPISNLNDDSQNTGEQSENNITERRQFIRDRKNVEEQNSQTEITDIGTDIDRRHTYRQRKENYTNRSRKLHTRDRRRYDQQQSQADTTDVDTEDDRREQAPRTYRPRTDTHSKRTYMHQERQYIRKDRVPEPPTQESSDDEYATYDRFMGDRRNTTYKPRTTYYQQRSRPNAQTQEDNYTYRQRQNQRSRNQPRTNDYRNRRDSYRQRRDNTNTNKDESRYRSTRHNRWYDDNYPPLPRSERNQPLNG